MSTEIERPQLTASELESAQYKLVDGFERLVTSDDYDSKRILRRFKGYFEVSVKQKVIREESIQKTAMAYELVEVMENYKTQVNRAILGKDKVWFDPHGDLNRSGQHEADIDPQYEKDLLDAMRLAVTNPSVVTNFMGEILAEGGYKSNHISRAHTAVVARALGVALQKRVDQNYFPKS